MRILKLDDALRVVLDPFDSPKAMDDFLAAEQMACRLMDFAYFGGKGKMKISEVESILHRMGAKALYFFKVVVGKQSPQGFIFVFNGVQFIGIAGTNDKLDVKTDLNFRPVMAESGGAVHEGVKNYWDAAFKSFESRLAKDLPVAGFCHSLGGGAIEHGMAELAAAGFEVVAVKTAGALMSGTDHRAKIVNRLIGSVYDRYVWGSDTVPSWPRDEWGYEHSVEPWEFSPAGFLTRSEGAARWERAKGRLAGVAHLRILTEWGGARLAGIAHHLLQPSYIGGISGYDLPK